MSDTEQLRQQINELTGAFNLLMERNANLERQIATLNPRANNASDLYKIPDPIKSLQSYDGKPKHLNQWLNAAEATLQLFQDGVTEQQYRVYFQAVLNKIEGKARDIICLSGNVQTFDEVKTLLINALGDRQEMSYYKSQLWQTKMTEDTTIHKYYANTKATIQNIKALAKQNATYNDNWASINQFIEEDALAAFIAGLRKPYFGYAQAAKPKDVEKAYAFLCKFTSHEKTASKITAKPSSFKNWEEKKFNKEFQQAGKPKSTKDEPMEVDPSLRSRMTFNKKLVNKNEIVEIEQVEIPSESEPEDDLTDEEESDEPISVNFQIASTKGPPV